MATDESNFEEEEEYVDELEEDLSDDQNRSAFKNPLFIVALSLTVVLTIAILGLLLIGKKNVVDTVNNIQQDASKPVVDTSRSAAQESQQLLKTARQLSEDNTPFESQTDPFKNLRLHLEGMESSIITACTTLPPTSDDDEEYSSQKGSQELVLMIGQVAKITTELKDTTRNLKLSSNSSFVPRTLSSSRKTSNKFTAEQLSQFRAVMNGFNQNQLADFKILIDSFLKKKIKKSVPKEPVNPSQLQDLKITQ